jgi:hypothetical protein
LALDANKSYVVNGAIFVTSTSAGPDVKFAFTTPGGATLDIGYVSHNIDGSPVIRAGLLEVSGAAGENIPIKANNYAIIQIVGTVSATTAGEPAPVRHPLFSLCHEGKCSRSM